MPNTDIKFHYGDEVRVIAGPLKDIEGIVFSIKGDLSTRIVIRIDLLGQSATVEIDSDMIELVRAAKDLVREELEIAVRPVSSKLIYDLAKDPNRMHQLSPRKFEELIAELLSDMGYDIIITPMTRDGGRDILAYFRLPHGEVLTIVDCKRFSKHRKIGPNIVERLMWIADHKDRASHAMIATTSYFSSGAKRIERKYKWQLSLKDFDHISGWLSRYGTWQKDGLSELWVPNSLREHICYLCGKAIEGKVSKEHVPPKQFFTKVFRQVRSPKLLTLPSHENCNKSYQDDEDYFFAALAGLNEKAQIHEWLIDDVRKKIWRDEACGLRQTVLSEFSSTVSGIYLPDSLVAKKFDLKRANRVVWKIIRGLCYHHYSRVLPENVKHEIRYWQIQDKPPKLYQKKLMNRPIHGEYPEVFCYKYRKVVNKNSLSALWALFFWQSIVAIVPVIASKLQDNENL